MSQRRRWLFWLWDSGSSNTMVCCTGILPPRPASSANSYFCHLVCRIRHCVACMTKQDIRELSVPKLLSENAAIGLASVKMSRGGWRGVNDVLSPRCPTSKRRHPWDACRQRGLLKCWPSTSLCWNHHRMGERTSLSSPTYSQSTLWRWRHVTSEQTRWHTFWYTSGSSFSVCHCVYTAISEGSLSRRLYARCARCTTSRNRTLLRTIPLAMAKCSDLIGRCTVCCESSGDGWVQQHQRRLRDAYQKAATQLDNHADQRKARHDRHARELPLAAGERVYLRNHGIRGRSKIQDAWQTRPYRVVMRQGTNDVYVVEPADGFGAQRTVNRASLRLCVSGNGPKAAPPVRRRRLPCLPSVACVSSSDTSDTSSAPLLWTVRNPVVRDVSPSSSGPESSSTSSAEEDVRPLLRRTCRSRAGTHSNPGNWPRPVNY